MCQRFENWIFLEWHYIVTLSHNIASQFKARQGKKKSIFFFVRLTNCGPFFPITSVPIMLRFFLLLLSCWHKSTLFRQKTAHNFRTYNVFGCSSAKAKAPNCKVDGYKINRCSVVRLLCKQIYTTCWILRMINYTWTMPYFLSGGAFCLRRTMFSHSKKMRINVANSLHGNLFRCKINVQTHQFKAADISFARRNVRAKSFSLNNIQVFLWI